MASSKCHLPQESLCWKTLVWIRGTYLNTFHIRVFWKVEPFLKWTLTCRAKRVKKQEWSYSGSKEWGSSEPTLVSQVAPQSFLQPHIISRELQNTIIKTLSLIIKHEKGNRSYSATLLMKNRSLSTPERWSLKSQPSGGRRATLPTWELETATPHSSWVISLQEQV